MSGFIPPGFGWFQGVPDFRDYTVDHPKVKRLFGKSKRSRRKLPDKVNLSEYLPEAYDQGRLNSSTAQACAALYTYFERRAHGRLNLPSRLFLYKVTRRLLMLTGDTGADLRSTLQAMQSFGMPAERFLPYDPARYDDEPEAFAYGFAEEFRDLIYVRLDARDGSGNQSLDAIRAFLAAGLPLVCGFGVPASIGRGGDIPYRPTFDDILGGQAVLVVGYDDRRLGATRGALLIRNSWGTDWGNAGNGWLPYAFVEEKLAVDFWTLLRPDWIKSGEFQQPKL